MTIWKWVEGRPCSPQDNMDLDAEALRLFKPSMPPVLRFYHWNALSATYGCFVDPARYFNFEGLKKLNVQIGKRPTGGGILFHHVDIAFSLLIPSTHPLYGHSSLESYQKIHAIVLHALNQLDLKTSFSLLKCCARQDHERFCMAHPSKYDLLVDGRKIAGAAQRRMRHALLHQGSLCLALPDQGFLKEVLRPSEGLIEAMYSSSCPLELDRARQERFKKEFFHALAHFSAPEREGN